MSTMKNMFRGDVALTILDLSNWDTSKVTNMENMFYHCYGLTSIAVSTKWNTSAVTTSTMMFERCESLVGQNGTKYTSTYNDKTYGCMDVAGTPGYFANEVVLPSSGLAYAGYILSHAMTANSVVFDYYTSDKSYIVDGVNVIDGVVGVDFSGARDGSIMAYYVNDALYILSDNLIIANNAFAMFHGSRATSIVFNNFDTSRVTSLAYMFDLCTQLTTLDLSGWDTSNVTRLVTMFYDCHSLTSINLSGWDVSKVQGINYMFYNCYKLTMLDLSSFDTSSVVNINCMFGNCSELTTIYVGEDWNTSSVTSGARVFEGCTKLVGGNGTVFSADNITYTYARVDTASTPGYLTLKS